MNKPKILIVDDEPFNVDYLEQELEDLDYDTIAAFNGREALEQVEVASPDVILLDIMMPEMDGFVVLEQLKAHEAWRNIPVIVISAMNDIDSVVRCIKLGAEDYLPKPVNEVLLQARLEASLEKKRFRDKEQAYLAEIEIEREKIEIANRDLVQTLEELQATQSQLIQSEKLAALGQLIAGIAHEINTPLGAINASIGNISDALEDSLRQLPPLLQQLSPEQQGEFFAMVDAALQNKTLLTSREERKLRRALRDELEDQGVTGADILADMLVEMRLHDGVEPYLPLLRADNAISILQSAYNLVSQQRSSQNIKTAVERASKIVFALRSYARQDHHGEKVEANIPENLDTVLTLYHNQLKQGVDVIKRYDEVPPLRCYADELNQVWTNLVHNALQAMEYRGVLEIEVKRLEIGDWRLGDKENDSPHLPISSSPHLLSVSITDSGSGIPDEIKGRIFDPFFTTKPAGEGSGLGLDIVRKIVEKHEGQIDFESEPGRTTFRVLLPLEERHGNK